MLINDVIFIAKGIFLTLEITACSLFIGLFLAIILSILRFIGYLNLAINIFISVMRGTPLILQLSLFYFAFPSLTGIKLDVFFTAIITFGLNSSAYIAEILRSGIENIPKGQFEAAESLHIPFYNKWKDIILPQVFRNVLPALINEFISLLKETAIISTIGAMDIMRRAQIISATEFTYFAPLMVAGLYYYILVFAIERLSKRIENKNKYVKHN
jgi:polar amino acid transport system permease protein